MNKKAALLFFLVTALAQGGVEFDGVNLNNQHIAVAHSVALQIAGNFTVETWAKTDGAATFNCIICKGVTTVPDWMFMARRSATDNISFWDKTAHRISDTGAFTTDTWHHAAVSWDSSDYRFYIDGVARGVVAGVQPPTSGANLRIGQQCAAGGNVFDGVLDELRVWSDVRTIEEIQANMNRRIAANEPGLIGYWRLDEGTGTLSNDLASANNGTLTNSPVWADSAPITYGE